MNEKCFFIVTLLIFVITACAPESSPTEEPSNMDEQPAPTQSRMDLTPAQRAVTTAFSGNLDLPVDKIILVSTQAVDWPDSCLGVPEEGLDCAQATTPGFRIIVQANGREVEYRTNEDGTLIRPATVLLTWKREGGIAGFCDLMTIYLSGEGHGSSCKSGQYVEQRLIDVMSKEEIAKLDDWVKSYGSVNIDASDPKGVSDRMIVALTFTGLGSQETVSSSFQQELLNFAQDLHQRLYFSLK
jgi:hypothetical protein